ATVPGPVRELDPRSRARRLSLHVHASRQREQDSVCRGVASIRVRDAPRPGNGGVKAMRSRFWSTVCVVGFALSLLGAMTDDALAQGGGRAGGRGGGGGGGGAPSREGPAANGGLSSQNQAARQESRAGAQASRQESRASAQSSRQEAAAGRQATRQDVYEDQQWDAGK